MCPEPGEQGVDLVDGMIRDAFENIGKIGLQIDAAQLCRFDDGVDTSGALSAGIGAAEEIILALMAICP